MTSLLRVVCKYGGSSLASPQKIAAIAATVARRHAANQAVVLICSAQAGTTDTLLAQAHALAQTPPRRELDMLLTCGERAAVALMAIALAERGVPAVSLTGSQAGIVTDDCHQDAKIVAVQPHRVEAALAAGQVVVVAGFQGVSRRREITTLGRGGSDVTAVALGAALKADEIHILSDVDGVYDADPRAVADALHLPEISYAQMHVLAQAGAKVLHPEAVRLAERLGVAVWAGEAHPGAATRLPTLVGADALEGALAAPRRALAQRCHVLVVTGGRGASSTSGAPPVSAAVPLPTEGLPLARWAALGGTCLQAAGRQQVWAFASARAARAARRILRQATATATATATTAALRCRPATLLTVAGADVGAPLLPAALAALAPLACRVRWQFAGPRQLSLAVAPSQAAAAHAALYDGLVGKGGDGAEKINLAR